MIPSRDSKDNLKMYEAKLKAHFKKIINHILSDRENRSITRDASTYLLGELVTIEDNSTLINILVYLMKDIQQVIYHTYTVAEELSSSDYVFMIMRDDEVGYSEYIKYDESLGLSPIKIEDIYANGDFPAIINDYVLQMDSPKFWVDVNLHVRIVNCMYEALREIYQKRIKLLEE